MIVTAAVEGIPDEAVLRKIVSFAGGEIGQVHGRSGRGKVLNNLKGYNHAARLSPWIVLVDLDRDAGCISEIRRRWLPDPAPQMCLRIAVRTVEAWLMADNDAFSSFFAVNRTHLSDAPDTLLDPKTALINAVRRSKRKSIRDDVVPSEALGQRVGPAYTSRMTEFVNSPQGWRVDAAALRSPSLRRAVASIGTLLTNRPEVS